MGVVFRLIKLQNIAWFLFIGILSQIGQGQTTNSAQSNKTNQEAIGLLFSPQDRDRAWGAYWIGKNRLRQYIPELQKMLSEIPRGEFSWIHDLTTRAALDSLIQLRAKVPLGELMPFYQRYPDEVLILLAQDAVGNQQGLLALLQEPPPTIRWLGICNLLAGTKAPGFASQMLHEMRIEVTVWVSEAGESGVGRGSGAAAVGCGTFQVDRRYPPTALYDLAECGDNEYSMIAPGPHSICYSREVVEPGGSIGVSSHDITIDRNPYRLQYLAVLLETSVEKLDFNPEPAYGLGWKGSEDYVFEINRIRAELQDSYSRLVALCLTRELLTEIEAVELIPEFSISVYDYRKDRTVPIPPLEIVQSVTALP